MLSLWLFVQVAALSTWSAYQEFDCTAIILAIVCLATRIAAISVQRNEALKTQVRNKILHGLLVAFSIVASFLLGIYDRRGSSETGWMAIVSPFLPSITDFILAINTYRLDLRDDMADLMKLTWSERMKLVTQSTPDDGIFWTFLPKSEKFWTRQISYLEVVSARGFLVLVVCQFPFFLC